MPTPNSNGLDKALQLYENTSHRSTNAFHASFIFLMITEMAPYQPYRPGAEALDQRQPVLRRPQPRRLPQPQGQGTTNARRGPAGPNSHQPVRGPLRIVNPDVDNTAPTAAKYHDPPTNANKEQKKSWYKLQSSRIGFSKPPQLTGNWTYKGVLGEGG